MKPKFRPYRSEDDFWRMRAFLRQVFVLNGYRQTSWHVARLDYARWHGCMNCAQVRLEDVAYLWENNGALVAFLLPEGGKGEAHLCIHPDLRNPELEEEMISLAEEHLSVSTDNHARLSVWSPEGDNLRENILLRRGYHKGELVEHQWQRDLSLPIPEVPLAPGYTIRSLGDGLELLERCYASGLGFHEGDIAIAVENRKDPTWYRNIQTAPLYRRDLDLVVIAPSGEIAAFCTIWFDDVTRSAYFEPVATVPDYQQRGLGKALLTEGLRRLQRMEARLAFVNGVSPAAKALYGSVMQPNPEYYCEWILE